jgi:DNA sulfur modification protein DndC
VIHPIRQAAIMPLDPRPLPATRLPLHLGEIAIKGNLVIDAIKRVLLDQRILSPGFSAGKDSSLVVMFALMAAAEVMIETGQCPPILLTHGNTGVENPLVAQHARDDFKKMHAYAERFGFTFRAEVAEPTIATSWQVKVIGGRGIPTFANAKTRDCTNDLKIVPQKRLRKALLKKYGSGDHPMVTLLGTRFEESPGREARMRERGETEAEVWTGEDGALYLSPIASYTMEDVWETLGSAKNGEFEAYSDFKDLHAIYAGAGGTSCAVVADMATGALKQARACGARTGCAVCCAVGRDKSMENLLASDPSMEYMRGLNKLQQWLVNHQYDWTKRNWVGRTIDAAGFVKIGPDQFSPETLENLLKWCLTLDVEEQEAAWRAGVAPRFRLINLDTLVAISAMWSLQGHFKPFHALYINRLVEDGARFPVPDSEPVPRTPLPKPRRIHIGNTWDSDVACQIHAGIYDPLYDEFAADCGPQVYTGEFYDVDLVGCEDVFGNFEDELLARHDAPDSRAQEEIRYWTQMGTITIARTHYHTYDEMLRRAAWKERNGLTGQVDIAKLIARSEPMPSRAAAEGQIDVAVAEAPAPKAGDFVAIDLSRLRSTIGSQITTTHQIPLFSEDDETSDDDRPSFS